MTTKEDPLRPFAMMGFKSRGTSSGQQHGDCPLCCHEDKLFIVEATGQWRCNYCKMSGNIFDYMNAYHADLVDNPAADWDALAADRGLPAEALQARGVVWDGSHGPTGAWVVPILNEKRHITYLQWYSLASKPRVLVNLAKGKWLTPGLGNFDLLSYPDCKHGPVFLCESFWDCVALDTMFQKEFVTCAVLDHPGASAFKQVWGAHFADRDVVLCYDNDKAGREGLQKTALALSGHARSVKHIAWPEAAGNGYDCRDFYKAGGTYALLQEMIAPLPENVAVSVKDTPAARMAQMPSILEAERPTLGDVRGVFGKWLHMTDDLDRVMRIGCAMKMCITQDGCPPWLYVVGTASSGKTEVLLSLSSCVNVEVVSGVRAATLVSGFNSGGHDPSIIPKLIGGLGVFKDWTEILRLNPQEKDSIYGFLTGAFDGEVKWRFGNGVYRDYKGRFNLIAGVTRRIMAESNATMGERFLSFNMSEVSLEDKKAIISAALENSQETQMQVELREVIKAFCDVRIEPEDIPPMPKSFYDRMIALVCLIAKLRAVVERDPYRRDLVLYKPIEEIGPRMAKQLQKIFRGLAAQRDGFEYMEEDWEMIIKRIGFDTCNEYALRITKAILEKPGCQIGDIEKMSGIGSSTLLNKISDLKVLGIVQTAKRHKDFLNAEYYLDDESKYLFETVGI